MTSLSSATQFSLVTTIGGAFDLNFNPLSHEAALAATEPVIWQVDFAVAVNELSDGDAGFGLLGLSLGFEDASDALDMGWQPYNETVSLGTGPLGATAPLFMGNLDAGGSSSDEQGILVHVAPGLTSATDPRRSIGQGSSGPQKVGSLFVQDVFGASSRISIDRIAFSGIDQAGKFFDGGAALGQATMTLPRATGGSTSINMMSDSTVRPVTPPVTQPAPTPATPVAPPVVNLPQPSTPSQPTTPAAPQKAGNFSLSTSIGGAFDLNLNPISHEEAMASTEPVIWQVDFGVTTDKAADDAGFGSVAFSVKFNDSSDALDLNWQANNPTMNSSSMLPNNATSMFMHNQDAGVSSSDEHGILVNIAPGVTNPNDPRKLIGQTGTDIIGSLFVQDLPGAMSSLTVENVEFAANDSQGKFLDVQYAYGANTMYLPRSMDDPTWISVSTANAPPVVEPEPTPIPLPEPLPQPPEEQPSSPEVETPVANEPEPTPEPDPTPDPNPIPEPENQPEPGQTPEQPNIPIYFPYPVERPWIIDVGSGRWPILSPGLISIIDVTNFEGPTPVLYFEDGVITRPILYTSSDRSASFDDFGVSEIRVPEPSAMVIAALAAVLGYLPARRFRGLN